MKDAQLPDGHIRIGLAHGAVQTFGSEDGGAEIIPPDRAVTAGLDYLALGDWHGRLRIGERTHYSGAPERDRFKHDGRGLCLAVTISGPGAVPVVEDVPTGRFDWTEIDLPMTTEGNPAEALARVLPANGARREDMLVRLRATGWVSLHQRLALSRAVQEVAPDFCHFEYDESGLETEYETGDLDEIDVGGALRLAAETLLEEAWDKALAEDRTAAEADDAKARREFAEAEAAYETARTVLGEMQRRSAVAEQAVEAAEARLGRSQAALPDTGDLEEEIARRTDVLKDAHTALAAASAEHDALAKDAPDLGAAEAAFRRAESILRRAEEDRQRLRIELGQLDVAINMRAGEAVEEELADTETRLEDARKRLQGGNLRPGHPRRCHRLHRRRSD